MITADNKKILEFLLNVSKLKEKPRRGWTIHKIKNAETTAEHIFYLVFLVWILGSKKRIDLDRAIKMALVHDLCEVYSPDFTSFDAVAVKEKGGALSVKDALALNPKIGRPTLDQRRKLEKVKKRLEMAAIKKVLRAVPPDLRKEMSSLWFDYENCLTPTGRFVKQADKTINFLQGLEYWKRYGKIQYDLWVRRIKEVVDDPVLIEFMNVVEKKFCSKCKK